MTSEFDKLEEDIIVDMRSTYTETAIDYAMKPRNVRSIQEADERRW